MEKNKEPLSVHMANDPDGALRELIVSIDPEVLQAFNKKLNRVIVGIAEIVRGLDRAIRGFASWAATIDWSAFIDGRWQLHLVVQVAEVALSRGDLSEVERHRISNKLKKFQINFAKIIESKEVCDKQTVLSVVEDALFIGLSAGVPADEFNAFRLEVEKKRQSLTNAHNARRVDDVQEIIDRLTKDLWARKPSYKTNREGTAKEIRIAVNREIAKLPKIPRDWLPSEFE